MLLRVVYFVLFMSAGLSDGLSVFTGHEDADSAAGRQSSQHVPSRVATTRHVRRAFRRSLVQIFGMKTRPRPKTSLVPAYMRWLYEQSASGRLPDVLDHLCRRRHKRRLQVTANTVRSFTGKSHHLDLHV